MIYEKRPNLLPKSTRKLVLALRTPSK